MSLNNLNGPGPPTTKFVLDVWNFLTFILYIISILSQILKRDIIPWQCHFT